jgi:hypothetical protein
MSRKAPLEACALCKMLKPTDEMRNVHARDAHGKIVVLRLCRSCVEPRITYIQANHRAVTDCG